MAGWNFEDVLQHLKKDTKQISSFLNVMLGHFCAENWAGLNVFNMLERPRALLVECCRYTIFWQRYYRKVTF